MLTLDQRHKEMVEEEETMSLTKPEGSRLSSTSYEDEKPLFHSNHKPPGPSVPFVISGDGESVPYTINRYLRDYQREGVKFIYGNYSRGRGCILGDDMGLGKTIQVISFLAAVLRKSGTWKDIENNVPDYLLSQRPSGKSKVKKVFLIVAPLSVLYNWKDELDTWGHFRSVVVHGVRKEEELGRVRRGRCEIALTTYETLRLCLHQFNSIDWAAVIVDEAHKIKNFKSQITQAMKEMKCMARIGLTGTILQNNLEELWCVMDWAVPGCLGSLGGFRNRFSDPIEQGQKHSATKRSLAKGRRAVQALAKKLSRWFLRRTKSLISDQLPKKDDRVVYCSLTDFQRSVYQAVLDTEDVSLMLQSSEKCHCGSGRTRRKCCYRTNADGVAVRHLYFSYLAILRKVANHVALLQSKEGTSKKQEKYVKAICENVFQKFPGFTERCREAAFEAMSDPMYSGKMKVMQRLLNHFVKKKDKVLLFSLSTKLLDVLESYCMAEGLEFRRLDGNTKPKDRVKIVKEFNSSTDINLCLVSTMAGGLGLNFVGANIVVLFDPTWNPANDLQAIDRAYRIGQCRDVTVFRLISLGTVEEVIYLRQIYKQQLQSSVMGQENARRYFEAVQGTEGQAGELFGVRNLFRLQTEGTCLTHRILEREGRVEVGIMTASTQMTEHRTLEPEREEVSGAGGGNVAHGGLAGQGLASGVLDFSSGSEDEEGTSSRPKQTASRDGEELGSPGNGVHGNSMTLSRLLQKHGKRRIARAQGIESSGSDEEEEEKEESEEESQSDGETGDLKSEGAHTRWALSSDSDGEEAAKAHVSSSSKCKVGAKARVEQSENAEVLQKVPQRYGTTRWSKVRDQQHRPEEDIESVNSSEDEVLVNRVNPGRGVSSSKLGAQASEGASSGMASGKRSVKFACLKSPDTLQRSTSSKSKASQEPPGGTLDTLLGGLQEVGYMHSNQRVVGSSRAENLLSHAALRDVFERRQYSQVPANQLLESLEASAPRPVEREEEGGPRMDEDRIHVEHSIMHTTQSTYHTPHTTVRIGETPSAICRKQLEDMAVFFGEKSLQAFAEDVLQSSSEHRLSKLRQFYSHRNPELGDMVTRTFSKLDTAATKPSVLPQNSSTALTLKPTSKKAHPKSSPKGVQAEVLDVEEQRAWSKKRVESSRTSEEFTHCVKKPTNSKRRKTVSSGSSQHWEKPALVSSMAPDDLKTHSRIVTRGFIESNEANSTTSSRADQAPQRKSCFIKDLIGDTSILDDLLKPKDRDSQDRPRKSSTSLSLPVGRAKSRTKDFWDILNEGNEEKINELTDLTQVERMCASVSASAKPTGHSDMESPQLWRKNENFLWKKSDMK